MALDVEKCRLAFDPRSIFELLPRPVIEQMIRGFLYRLKKGMTLIWSEYDSRQRRWTMVDERLDPFAYSISEDRQFYNDVCWQYRLNCGDGNCHKCDRQLAQELADGTRTEIASYSCWLGLDELAYPLRIGGRVRAVLFCGQIVPNDEARIAQIEANIRANTSPPLSEKLCELLHEQRGKQWSSDPNYARTVTEGLTEFGDMVQNIVTNLYEARKDAFTLELLQSAEQSLVSADLSDSRAWWVNCEQILRDFAALVQIREVRAFVRNRSRYEQRLPPAETPTRIATREVLSSIPAGQLQHAFDETHASTLAEKLGMPPNQTWFYVSHAHPQQEALSTLLVLCGDLDSQYKSLCTSFCRIVTQNADFFALVEHQLAAQKKYRETVGQVAHDFRTPLQVLLFDLQETARLREVAADPVLSNRLQDSAMRALGAEEHVAHLLSVSLEEKTPIDLLEVLDRVLKDLESIAKRHPCELRRVGVWPASVTVRGVAYQLRRALTNLIENAIKYSYHGVVREDRKHYVEVRVEIVLNNMICVSIRNYGIGIPAETLERMRAPGGRALVEDPEYSRPGTGWGLPIAIRVLEDHNGWLDISSRPPDSDRRGLSEEYHRYVTTVKAYLPRDK